MSKQLLLVAVLILALFSCILTEVQFVNLATANPYVTPTRSPTSIYIEIDGSINPSSAPIQQIGNLYTLTDNIQGHSIWIQRDNAVLDGAGYTLQGNGSERGVVLNCTKNVTVKNIQIKGFYTGITIQRQLAPSGPYGILPNPYPVSRNNSVIECSIADNTESGILVWASSNNKLTGNIITGSNKGIELYDNTDDVVSGNEVSENSVKNNGCGIMLESCVENKISGNNVTGNRGYGIELHSSLGNILSENLVLNNGFGILVSASTKNRITENMVAENNGWGIRLERSQANNLIYRNNFIDNKVSDGLQVSIPWYLGVNSSDYSLISGLGLGNFWNYGSEGNYWSDYETRYPNATELGSSGVWDTPFYINENNIDYYPLMKPFAISGVPTAPEQQQDSLGTTLPIEYGYAFMAVVAIATLVAYLLRKRKKSPVATENDVARLKM